jgi:Na+-driven multidrug efflux pump
VQNSVIGLANVVVQANINIFGTMAVAGCGAYGKLEGFAFLPITSFTIALTTFVGQNLGAAKLDRAKRGAAFGVVACLIASELMGLLLYLAAPALVGLFTVEPEAIAFGVDKGRICSVFFCLLAASHGLAAVLRGAGKAVVPMVSMLLFWCVVRVAFLEIMVPLYPSINTVNWAYPITWALSVIFLGIYYWKADWVHSFDKAGA